MPELIANGNFGAAVPLPNFRGQLYPQPGVAANDECAAPWWNNQNNNGSTTLPAEPIFTTVVPSNRPGGGPNMLWVSTGAASAGVLNHLGQANWNMQAAPHPTLWTYTNVKLSLWIFLFSGAVKVIIGGQNGSHQSVIHSKPLEWTSVSVEYTDAKNGKADPVRYIEIMANEVGSSFSSVATTFLLDSCSLRPI